MGKKSYIEKLEHFPLMRAIRLDKCAIAALSATFREYMDETRAVKNIPVLSMIARPLEELKAQAENLYGEVKEIAAYAKLQVEESISMVGGGSLPGETLASFALTLQPKTMSCEELMEKMRNQEVPVIGHIKNEKIWLDMRTILPEEKEYLKKCLLEIKE